MKGEVVMKMVSLLLFFMGLIGLACLFIAWLTATLKARADLIALVALIFFASLVAKLLSM
jgi:hypothetical protein